MTLVVCSSPLRGSAGQSLRRRFLTSFLAWAVLAPARAEDPRSAFHEEAEVLLVQVPVTVTGRDGQPLRGLSPADFELFDDGTRQRIEALDVVDLRQFRQTQEGPWTLPPEARRHYLLLFDLSYARPGALLRAQEAATRFVGEVLGPEELAAVATVSAETGSLLLATFTADRRQLIAAIRSLAMPPRTDGGRDPLAFSLQDPGAQSASQPSLPPPPGPPGEPQSGASAKQMEMLGQRSADDLATRRVERHLGALGGLATALDAVAGQKTIVFFSEGFDERLLEGNVSHATQTEDNDAMLHGQLWAVDLDRRFANAPLSRVLDETVEGFRRSECEVYPVDISEAQIGESGELESPHRGAAALGAIAKGSGGEVIQGTDALDPSVERLRERKSLTYVLAFRPSRKAGENHYHRLKIRVKQSGARVEGRAGYYETRRFASLSPLQRALSAADVITHERESSGIPMSLLALNFDSEALSRVSVLIEIPGESLLSKNVGATIRLGIYVYAVSESGEVGDFISRSLKLDLVREAARLRAGPLRYLGQLRLPPGRYRIRALVRDEEGGRSGFRAASLEVAGPKSASALHASIPLFLSGPEGGMTLRDTPGKAEIVFDLFELSGQAFVPALDPALPAERPSRVCLLLWTAAAAPDIQIQGRILGAGGQQWPSKRLAVVDRTARDAAGRWKVLLEFEAPELPAGRYALAITLLDPADPSAPSLVRQANFRIL